MNMQSIKIDLDVYKAIELKRESFQETRNDILRRVLGLSSLKVSSGERGVSEREGWAVGGVFFPKGTRMHAIHKGHVFEAEVVQGGMLFKNVRYKSPSGAAVEATGVSTNGWIFWEYFDTDSGKWYVIDHLRNQQS